LHAYSAVLDIRTIVECSPQFGHTEASSKRCRQLAQRVNARNAGIILLVTTRATLLEYIFAGRRSEK